jgi:hypothetical protein
MKLFYALLLGGVLLAAGLLTYNWGFDFGSLGSSGNQIRVKWTAPAIRPGGEPLELKQMSRTRQALDEHARYLSSAELYVDSNRQAVEEVYGAPVPKEVRYTVCLVLSDGTRLEARSRQSDWARLDKAMAGTVTECLEKYQELRKRHGLRGGVREITNF